MVNLLIFKNFKYYIIFYFIFNNFNYYCCFKKKLNNSINYENNDNNLDKIFKNEDKKDKKDKKDEEKDKKDKKDEKDINTLTDEVVKSIFESLSTKKIFYDDNYRKKDDFKHFQFIKNMFPNGDNRCWLISEIIAFFNTPYIQEILLNNKFDDNIYLKSLQKLLLDCRNKNSKKQQLNCDEFTKLIDDYINRNSRFNAPLYQFTNFSSERENRKLGSFKFKNFSEFTIRFKEDITNVINLDKIKNNDPILYSVKVSLNYEIGIKFDGNNRLLEYNNIPFQKDEKSENHIEIMYIFSDKSTEYNFFEILTVKHKKKYSNLEEFYEIFEDIFNKIKENFKFECNSIIMYSRGYHYFSFCKNPENNNWYNFNSLDDQYGEMCNETIDELIKNKKLTISGREYIPDLFIISVSSK